MQFLKFMFYATVLFCLGMVVMALIALAVPVLFGAAAYGIYLLCKDGK